MNRFARVTAVAALLAGVLAACSAGIVPGRVTPDRPAPFPECQADAYAFVGEASLAAIGLAEVAGRGPEANRVGAVWVTAEPVDPDAFGAPVIGPDGGAVAGPPPGRAVCVEWPDGSGMMTVIDGSWQPPGVAAGLSASSSDDGLPFGLIGAVIAMLVLVGVSYLAFRRGEARTT